MVPDGPATRPCYSLRPLLAFAGVSGLTSLAGGVVARSPAIAAVSAVLVASAAARLRRGPPPTTRHALVAAGASALVGLTLAAAAVTATLAGLEGACRWIYRDVTSTADFRGYFTTRWLRTQVRHNHYDYRGAEFDEVKAPGVYRVAVMGDSFTYGNGVREEARFSNLVGAAVRDRGIEVLNFGFPGNNWPEHIRTLERRVLRLRPDFVLLQWGTNDIELDEDVAGRPRVPPLIADRGWHEWLHERSALYTIVNAAWLRLTIRRQMGDTYDRYLTRLYADPASTGARLAAASLRRFVAAARAGGAGVALILFPDAAVSLGPDYPYQFMHDAVAAQCRDLRVTCVDLLPAYRRVPDRFALWVTPLDFHPSALANRLAADAILATIAPAWGSSGRQAHPGPAAPAPAAERAAKPGARS